MERERMYCESRVFGGIGPDFNLAADGELLALLCGIAGFA
jgi:hypothetical protein